MNNTILLNGHTRTGTELLLAILRSRGFYTLGEIVTNSVPQSYITRLKEDPTYERAYFDKFNVGLRYQLNDKNVSKKVVKVMINHLHTIRPHIHGYITDRILLWRQDMFASQISHQTALARNSWIRWGDNQPQEWKSDVAPATFSLDVHDFAQRLQWRIRDWEELLDNLPHQPEYTLVTEYRDVVEYSERNPNSGYTRPTLANTITNLAELQEIYNRHHHQVEAINGRLLLLQADSPSLEQYIDQRC